jgi:hypothetical protein
METEPNSEKGLKRISQVLAAVPKRLALFIGHITKRGGPSIKKPENSRSPKNDHLKTLFVDVVAVIIKEGGADNNRALTNKVALALSGEEKVRKFGELLEIVEPDEIFYCLCLGNYAIELYAQDRRKATIGFHHGTSIRFTPWGSDAELRWPDELAQFLADEGLKEPLRDRIRDKREAEARATARQNWLAMAPKCFAKYWEAMNNLHKAYLPELMEELNAEYPDRTKRIIVLLQTFGTTDYPWNASPIYELIPSYILQRIEVKEIAAAYLGSAKSPEIRKGLGRFIYSAESKEIQNHYLKFVPQEIIDDLEGWFETSGEQRNVNGILSFRNEKNSG